MIQGKTSRGTRPPWRDRMFVGNIRLDSPGDEPGEPLPGNIYLPVAQRKPPCQRPRGRRIFSPWGRYAPQRQARNSASAKARGWKAGKGAEDSREPQSDPHEIPGSDEGSVTNHDPRLPRTSERGCRGRAVICDLQDRG